MGSAFVVVLVLMGVSFKVARLLGMFDSDARALRPAPDPTDPRWYGSAGEQLTGRACVDCSHKIAVEKEGRFCRQCSSPLHRKRCSKRHKALVHPVGGPAPYR